MPGGRLQPWHYGFLIRNDEAARGGLAYAEFMSVETAEELAALRGGGPRSGRGAADDEACDPAGRDNERA